MKSLILVVSLFIVLTGINIENIYAQNIPGQNNEMNKTPRSEFVNNILEIFSYYYAVLEEEVKKSQSNSSNSEIQESKATLENEYNKFWQIPEFSGVSNREDYFKKIEERLQNDGYFLDITPQYGIDTGNLHLETVDNISLRPVISVTKKESKIGGKAIEYTEFDLGESLIKLPSFIEPIVESASSTKITIFPIDLFKTLQDDYNFFKIYNEEAKKRFKQGVINPDNIFCVQLKLLERQWGTNPPDSKRLDRLISLFQLHGQQHVSDFKSLESKDLFFVSEDPTLTESLNRDSLLEARVMVRQLLEKRLPYYVLSQILNYQREWMQGSLSEYDWAGHIIFEGFTNKLGPNFTKKMPWANGVESLSEEEIYRIALAFAYNNMNFMDMLTLEQLDEAKSLN